MKAVFVIFLFGLACCQAALFVEDEYNVDMQIRFIGDDNTDRAPRVRRKAWWRRDKDKSSDSSEGSSSGSFEGTFEEGSFGSSSQTSPFIEESSESEEPQPKVGKAAKEIEITITLGQGENTRVVQFKGGKRKKLSIDTKTFKLGADGELVEDTADTSGKEVSLFEDASNGTGTYMLMDCDDTSCKVMGSIYGETGIYVIEPAEAEPFASKGKDVSLKGPKEMEDVRVLGQASDGSTLNIPVTLRKKRDILLTEDMKDSIRSRRRRQTGATNVVELLFIADYSEYHYWLERAGYDEAEAKLAIQLYFVLLTNMMDFRFQDLNTQKGDDVKFMLNQIVYATSAAASPWIDDNLVGDVVNANKALDDFTVWAYPKRNTFLPHDHIMVVSKRNLGALVNGVMNSDTIGVAWTGGMCNTAYSISIIEDPGLGLIDYAATHEIGHSMSSNHDSALGCSDDDYFIMGSRGGGPAAGLSSVNKSENPFLFSSCAADSIHNFISSLGAGSCLLQNNYDQSQYDQFKAFLAPGVFLPVDTQCELNYGNGSRRCYALDPLLCSDGAWCWNPNEPNYCYSLYVREGTLCSENQRCHRGTCVDSNIVAPTCPPRVYSSINAEQVANGGGVIVDTGNNVAGAGVTTGPSSGTPQATYQAISQQTLKSADVIC